MHAGGDGEELFVGEFRGSGGSENKRRKSSRISRRGERSKIMKGADHGTKSKELDE